MRLLVIFLVLLYQGFEVASKDEIVASPEEIAKREPDGDHILQEESHGNRVLIPPDGEITAAAVRRAEAQRFPSRKPDKFQELMEETDIREIHRIIVPPIKDITEVNLQEPNTQPPIASENQAVTPISVINTVQQTEQKPKDVTTIPSINLRSFDTTSDVISIKNDKKVSDNNIEIKRPIIETITTAGPIKVEIKTEANTQTTLFNLPTEETTIAVTDKIISFQIDPIIVQDVIKPSVDLLPPFEEKKPTVSLETQTEIKKPSTDIFELPLEGKKPTVNLETQTEIKKPSTDIFELPLEETTKSLVTTTILSETTTPKQIRQDELALRIKSPSVELELPLEDQKYDLREIKTSDNEQPQIERRVSNEKSSSGIQTNLVQDIKANLNLSKNMEPEKIAIDIPNKIIKVQTTPAPIEINKEKQIVNNVSKSQETVEIPNETTTQVSDVIPPTSEEKKVLVEERQPLLGNVVIKNVNSNKNINSKDETKKLELINYIKNHPLCKEVAECMDLLRPQLLFDIHISLAPYSELITKALQNDNTYAQDYSYDSQVQKRSIQPDLTTGSDIQKSNIEIPMPVAETLYYRRQSLNES